MGDGVGVTDGVPIAACGIQMAPAADPAVVQVYCIWLMVSNQPSPARRQICAPLGLPLPTRVSENGKQVGPTLKFVMPVTAPGEQFPGAPTGANATEPLLWPVRPYSCPEMGVATAELTGCP